MSSRSILCIVLQPTFPNMAELAVVAAPMAPNLTMKSATYYNGLRLERLGSHVDQPLNTPTQWRLYAIVARRFSFVSQTAHWLVFRWKLISSPKRWCRYVQSYSEAQELRSCSHLKPSRNMPPPSITHDVYSSWCPEVCPQLMPTEIRARIIRCCSINVPPWPESSSWCAAPGLST